MKKKLIVILLALLLATNVSAARLFVTASSQYLQNTNPLATFRPITISVWVYPTSVPAATKAIFAMNDIASANYFIRIAANSSAQARVDIKGASGAELASASTSNTFSANKWQHVWATITGSGSNWTVNISLDNGTVATASDNDILDIEANIDRTTIGAREYNTGYGNFWDGRIGEVAIWNIEQSADDRKALSRRWSPILVRFENLIHHWTLIRDIKDRIGGLDMINNGTVVTAHSPVILAASPHIITAPSVAAPEGPGGAPTQMIGPIISKLFTNPITMLGAIGFMKHYNRTRELMK